MKLFTRLMLVLAILLSTTSAAFAREVKGNVVDTADEPLIGVSVVAGQSKTGVSTDIDGNFTITVPNGPVTLKFSYVGYTEKTVNVAADQSEVKVVLEESSTMLEETVVIGYGTQKKVNLTGAVATVDGAKFEDRTGGSVTNMLQGAVAGLNVSVTNGRPGTSGSLNIRGTTSINSAEPLVLIDGSVGEINDLNPNDIDNISVIKDASAAAVYGARAAFGVVLITTKSGQEKEGKATVRYSGRFGWTSPTTSTEYETRGYWSVYTTNEFFMADSGKPYWDYSDYDMQQLLARVNDKTEHPDRPWVVTENRNGRNQWYYYANHDWYHSLFRDTKPSQQHNISVSGGNKAVKYFLSGGFDRQEGMLKVIPDVYKKYNMRSKIDFNVNKWITMSNNTSFFGSTYDYQGRSGIDATLGYMGRHALACVPLMNPDGTQIRTTPYSGYAVGNSRHSQIIDGKHPNIDRKTDFTTTFRLNANPIKQLSVTADFTYRFYQARNQNRGNNVEFREYPDQDIQIWNTGAGLNDLRETINTRHYYAVNAFATYKETFAENHNLQVMAGYNYERLNIINRGMSAENLISEDLTDFNLVGVNSNGDKISDVTGSQNQYALQGIFGRVNYDYKGKYLLEFSGRYDGTSRFGRGHRWGFFPSGSAGWRFSEEEFFASLRNLFNNAKLRVSYGELGNQNVSSYYTFLRMVTTNKFDSFTFDGANKAVYSSLGAPIASDMTWETSKQWDLGLDFSMLNNRLSFTGDLYIRDTHDMLTDGIALPSVYGADPPQMNTADLRTKGYEAAITWNDNFQLFGHPFTYSVGFNISDYRSHITRYDNPDKSFAKDYYVGQRIGEIWGYKVDGYFKTTEEAQEYAKHVDLGTVTKRVTGGWQAGDIKFLDLDGDRKIGVGSNTADNPGDRTILGNSLASLQYGINASIRYFGFDVSAFFQGTGNHYWYPTGQCMPFWGAYSYSYVSFLRSDFRDLIWSEDNPDAYFPRPMAYAATSGTLSFVNDRYLQNLRYLRFKNLTVGYSLPQKWIRKAYLEKVRVYFTGENLCYWSPLKKNTRWLDPESAYNRSEQNNNLAYTFPKTYMVGIDITF